MASQQDLDHLLSNKYDPADESPSRFRQSYSQLVKYCDDLRQKHDLKEQKRASIMKAEIHSAPSTARGSRFSSLPDNDDGSTISSPTKHSFTASLTAIQIGKLPNNERKKEVAKIKKDIEVLRGEKKGKRAVAAKKPQEEEKAGDRVEEGMEQEEARQAYDGADEIDMGLKGDWTTVNHSGKR